MLRQLGSHGNSDWESIRAALLDKKNEILSGMGFPSARFVFTGRVSEEDQPQVSHDEYIAVRLNSFGREQLRLVEAALHRLDTDGFGRCLECGQSIPRLRLQAIPWAEFCVVCQRRTTDLGPLPSYCATVPVSAALGD